MKREFEEEEEEEVFRFRFHFLLERAKRAKKEGEQKTRSSNGELRASPSRRFHGGFAFACCGTGGTCLRQGQRHSSISGSGSRAGAGKTLWNRRRRRRRRHAATTISLAKPERAALSLDGASCPQDQAQRRPLGGASCVQNSSGSSRCAQTREREGGVSSLDCKTDDDAVFDPLFDRPPQKPFVLF